VILWSNEEAMLGLKRGTAVAVAVMGLAGCFSGNATGPSDATPSTALVGPTWRVTRIGGQPVLAGTTITAEFTSEDRVAGSAGCNRYFGSAKAESGKIEMGPFGATRMACSPNQVMAQEGQFLGLLDAAARYTVVGDELRIGPSENNPTLVFSSR
jgi:heat shock protein HslJ